MTRRTLQGALTAAAAATFVVTASAQDIRSFKGGVRIAAATCAARPVGASATITSVLGDVAVSNPDPVKVRVVCHLPVPEGAVIRRFVMTGVVPAGEIFATLSVKEAADPGQAPFFAHLVMNPATPFEVAGKQQKVSMDLPATGSESLTVSRMRAHYIEAMITTKPPLDQPVRLFFFEVYWN
jgi:hypothetical protein